MNIVKRGIFFLRQNGPSALIRHIIAHPKYRLELFKAKSTILFKNNKIKVVDKDKRIRIKQNGVIVNFKIQDICGNCTIVYLSLISI